MPLRFRILQGQVSPGDPSAAPSAWGAPVIERMVELADLEEIRIGRRAGLELTLPFPTVSALHAVIRRVSRERRWSIEDRGSTNGSWLAKERLDPGVTRPLLPGQTFRIGEVTLAFDGWVEKGHASSGTGSLARRLVADLFSVLSGGDSPRLLHDDGRSVALVLDQREKPYGVGRAAGNALVLDHPSVSRLHAMLVRRWDGVWVRDQGGKNPLQVNGRALTGELHLRDGDRLTLGAFTLVLEDPEDRYLHAMEDQDGPAPTRFQTLPTGPRRGTSGPRRAVPWDEPSGRTNALSLLLGLLAAGAVAGAAWTLLLR